MAVAQSNILIAKCRFAAGGSIFGLISLRDRPEFEGAIDEGDMWIRVAPSSADEAIRVLSLVGGAEIFRLDDQQRLTPIHRSVPVGLLPKGLEWKPISQLTRLWLPTALRATREEIRPTASSVDIRVPLKWIRSEQYAAPSGLLCSFADWSYYVLNNIHAKWRGLRFACRPGFALDSRGAETTLMLDTLVVGEPIPSIPGLRLLNSAQVLMPVAFTWTPAVPAQAIRRSIGVTDSDWLLWGSEASLEVLSDSDFITTTRVSIRATAAALAMEKANASTERDGP